MRRQIVAAVGMLAAMTLLCGVAYPLVATVLARVAFSDRAAGSLVRDEAGEVVGSRLIGQNFVTPEYFHPRPSAAGEGYDPTASAASNLGPSNPALHELVAERVAAYRETNGLPAGVPVPIDAVTASGSGLDPHISPSNARLQAGRVAKARGLPVDEVLRLVDEHTLGRPFGVLGEAAVDVLALNLALDAIN